MIDSQMERLGQLHRQQLLRLVPEVGARPSARGLRDSLGRLASQAGSSLVRLGNRLATNADSAGEAGLDQRIPACAGSISSPMS